MIITHKFISRSFFTCVWQVLLFCSHMIVFVFLFFFNMYCMRFYFPRAISPQANIFTFHVYTFVFHTWVLHAVLSHSNFHVCHVLFNSFHMWLSHKFIFHTITSTVNQITVHQIFTKFFTRACLAKFISCHTLIFHMWRTFCYFSRYLFVFFLHIIHLSFTYRASGYIWTFYFFLFSVSLFTRDCLTRSIDPIVTCWFFFYMYCTWLVTWLTVFSRDPTLFMWYHTFGFILRSLGNEPSRDLPHVITSYSHIHVWNVCDFSVRCYFDPWENVLTYKHTYTNMNTSLVCMSVYCLLYKWYTRFDVNIVEKKKKRIHFVVSGVWKVCFSLSV